MSIGVAILGGGIFAREEHKPAVESSPHLTLKAVWSRSLQSAKSLEVDETKVDLYSEDQDSAKTLKELLTRDDIQAVIIALPISSQPAYISQVLDAGKHVLSEKPIAPTIKKALELMDVDKFSKTSWAIAENFRYLPSYSQAASLILTLGRILTFSLRTQFMITPGGKYFETPWRKQPSHPGGFLLDGGVHSVAGLRLLLGKDYILRISANTAQLQRHLPPQDTIQATCATKSGAVGTISLSFGTTVKTNGTEILVGCDQGWVKIERGKVSSAKTGNETEVRDFQDEGSGVAPEVRAWAEALEVGRSNKEQSPEEALADLEILEACLQSGSQGGAPIYLKHQDI